MNFDELKEVIVDTLGCDEDKVTENASLMEDLDTVSKATFARVSIFRNHWAESFGSMTAFVRSE